MGGDILRTYRLDHLSCANCANKIESKINELPYVDRARIDFTSKRCVVEGESPEMLDDIQRIASSVEEDVVVRELDEKGNPSSAREEGEDEASLKKEILTIAVLVVAAFFISRRAEGAVETALMGGILLIGGFDIFRNALGNIRKGAIFDENFLMAIASVAAFYIGEHAEALGVLLFYRLGEALQDYAVDRATDSVEELLERDVSTARLLRDGEILEVDAEEVKVGDRLILRAGDTLVADGKVLEGKGHVSNQHMTGESTPIALDVGSAVLAGAIALDGAFEIEITEIAEESTMAKIERLVDDARLNKSRTETWIGRFAAVYTPVVVAIAAAVAIVAPLFFGEMWDPWIYKACAFLIISCPCALVLSVPLTMFASVGRASKEGIFVKGSTAMERLSEISAIAFDKTGTLTDGKFSVARVDAVAEKEARILSVAATAEQFSNHPIAKSLLERARPEGRASDYKEISGKGIICKIDGKQIAVGNEKLLETLRIENPLKAIPMTSVFVVEEGVLLGRIAFSDSIKVGVAEALNHLNRSLKTYIFSGDKKELVERVGEELGVDTVFGGLLPDQKVDALDRALSENKGVVYVGDGINDAPVIAKSDVGIAMGTGGSDMAIESADVVILGDDIAKIPFLFGLAKRTRAISFFNIGLALAVKAIVAIVSFLGIGNLWLAVFADVGVSLICVLIAMTMMAYKS